MKKKEKEKVQELLDDWIPSFKPCFCIDSPSTWIKHFAEKRVETFIADKQDYIEEKCGIDLNNEKNLKDFKKMYVDYFIEVMTNYISELKVQKNEEIKREIREHGCKRKPQKEGKSKKKK